VDRFVQRVFLGEILTQCQFVLLAAEQLDQALAEVGQQGARRAAYAAKVKAELHQPPTPGDMAEMSARFARRRQAHADIGSTTETTNRIWFALQGILVSAANISKLLWGAEPGKKPTKAEADRKKLRLSIGVGYRSPLRDRALRNGFEHFDEQLDAWAQSGPPRGYIGRIIGPLTALRIRGTSRSRERFGNYDPATGRVIFWTRKSASIPRIVAEVRSIYPLVVAEAAKPLWPLPSREPRA